MKGGIRGTGAFKILTLPKIASPYPAVTFLLRSSGKWSKTHHSRQWISHPSWISNPTTQFWQAGRFDDKKCNPVKITPLILGQCPPKTVLMTASLVTVWFAAKDPLCLWDRPHYHQRRHYHSWEWFCLHQVFRSFWSFGQHFQAQ